MKTGTRGLLLVTMDIDPEHEDEFNRWYDEEHVPERRACRGFLSARRFVAIEGKPKYMAFYELESPAVLESESYREIYDPSNWTKEMQKRFKNFSRNVYIELLPEAAAPMGSRSRFKTSPESDEPADAEAGVKAR